MAKAKKLQNCMESGRLLLRPWLESDAEALFKYASDPEPRDGEVRFHAHRRNLHRRKPVHGQ